MVQLFRLARHEGAHVLAAAVLGEQLISATIIATPEAAGSVTHHAPPGSSATSAEQARTVIIIALAGGAATGADPQKDWECIDDEAAALVLARRVAGDQAEALLAECRREAHELVEDFGGVIERLAHELVYGTGTLADAYLQDVVARAIAEDAVSGWACAQRARNQAAREFLRQWKERDHGNEDGNQGHDHGGDAPRGA